MSARRAAADYNRAEWTGAGVLHAIRKWFSQWSTAPRARHGSVPCPKCKNPAMTFVSRRTMAEGSKSQCPKCGYVLEGPPIAQRRR